MLGTFVSVIITAVGSADSISVLSNLTTSCVSDKLILFVPTIFQRNAMASSRNILTPASRYCLMIEANAFNTSGLRKSKSTWSWLKVHQTNFLPLPVPTSFNNVEVRGRTTFDKLSIVLVSTQDNFLPRY